MNGTNIKLESGCNFICHDNLSALTLYLSLTLLNSNIRHTPVFKNFCKILPNTQKLYSLKNLTIFPSKLRNEHFKEIYNKLDDEIHLHGASFDLFGVIYEEFASQTKKKQFGEFYTRRHITGLVCRLILRNELTPRDLKICDPACGSGGFLTEAYKTLYRNYDSFGRLNPTILKQLKQNVFWGYDNDEKSVARTQLNMFLVGDGHIHIYDVDDSLVEWNNEIGWTEDHFDCILTNPPMGKYKGEADIDYFDYTNEKRYELLFTEKAVKATKPGGEIAIVLNDGSLEAPTRERFRINLLHNCNIYAILSLTKFAFAPYTKEKTYVLFMQKKQNEDVGNIQEFPIWHYILDYDGFANSDKRFRTKFHDDLPELEDIFSDAIELSRIYVSNNSEFESKRHNFERNVNNREKEEGLDGMKFGYVEIKKICEDNYHNLLSEFYLRPIVFEEIKEQEFDEIISDLNENIGDFYEKLNELKSLITADEDEN